MWNESIWDDVPKEYVGPKREMRSIGDDVLKEYVGPIYEMKSLWSDRQFRRSMLNR